VRVDLLWAVVAVTVATFTVLLGARRIAMVVGDLVFHRYVAVGGLVAFTLECEGDVVAVRFEAGGPAVLHNVGVHVFGAAEVGGTEVGGTEVGAAPPLRHTMAAGDDPIEWRFSLDAAADGAWVLVTWVRPYLQGVESEALAQRVDSDQLYEWRWYSETTRYVRTVLRFVARRVPAGAAWRDIALYGRWRRTSSTARDDLLGPAAEAPPG
jgi:hypothetical protein